MVIIDLLAYRPAAIFFSLISLPFPYASLSFPSCLARIILNSLLFFRGRNCSKTILVVLPTNFAAYSPNRPALHFLLNDLIGSRSTGGHLEISSINNQRRTRVFICFLAYFPEANLSSTSLPSIFWKYSKTFRQQPENIQRLFSNNPEIFKDPSPTTRKNSDFFACEFVLAANHQLYPENIQRPLGQQQSTATISESNQQQQSATAPSSSNQRQQPAAAISDSNQQQQSATLTSSSNQRQQPAAAISDSNQQLPSY